MPKVDCVLPAARAWRNRRTMFSTSMMASSTTTPTATTRPASTITFTVAPATSSTSSAATRDSGMAIRLMNAVRHSNRKATMIKATSRMPSRIARVRLSIDCSMKVAGRKIVVSTSMPRSPGAISAMASSTPLVTSTVFAPRNFWTTSNKPWPVVHHGVADQRTRVHLDLAQVGQPQDLAVPFQHRNPAEVLRSDDRLHVSDIEPLASRSPRIRRCRPRRRRSSGAVRRRARRPRRSSPAAG